MDSRPFLGANRIDAVWHREDLQRRPGREDAVLCRNERVTHCTRNREDTDPPGTSKLELCQRFNRAGGMTTPNG
jgi:hypothetical protein